MGHELLIFCLGLAGLTTRTIVAETLLGSGSLEDPLYWYLLECSHVVI
jgi:hypothetical protein